MQRNRATILFLNHCELSDVNRGQFLLIKSLDYKCKYFYRQDTSDYPLHIKRVAVYVTDISTHRRTTRLPRAGLISGITPKPYVICTVGRTAGAREGSQ